MYLSALIALATNQINTLRAFYPLETQVSGVVEYRLAANADEDAPWQQATWQCTPASERQVCTWQPGEIISVHQPFLQYRLAETPDSIQVSLNETSLSVDDTTLTAFNDTDFDAAQGVYYSSIRQLPDEQSRFVSLSFVQSSDYHYSISDAPDASLSAVVAKDKILLQTRSSQDGAIWSPWQGGWQVLEGEAISQADKMHISLPMLPSSSTSSSLTIAVGDKIATLSSQIISPVKPVAAGADEAAGYTHREITVSPDQLQQFHIGDTLIITETVNDASYSATAAISDINEREGIIWIDNWQGAIPRRDIGTCEDGREFCFSTQAKLAVLPSIWLDITDDAQRDPDAIVITDADNRQIDNYNVIYGKIDVPSCNDGNEQICTTGLTMPISSPPGKFLQYRLIYGDNRDVRIESVGVNVSSPGLNINNTASSSATGTFQGRLRGGKVFDGSSGSIRPYFWK